MKALIIAAASLAALLIVVFLPLRFKVSGAVRALDVSVRFKVVFFKLKLYSARLFYDGKFYLKSDGRPEPLEFSYEKSVTNSALMCSISLKKLHYTLVISLENLHSTMQITAFIEYSAKLLNAVFSTKTGVRITSAATMAISENSLFDVYAEGIIQLRIADIIKNTLKKLVKGAGNGKHKSHRSRNVDSAA